VTHRVVHSSVWPVELWVHLLCFSLLQVYFVRLKPRFTSNFKGDCVHFARGLLVLTLLSVGFEARVSIPLGCCCSILLLRLQLSFARPGWAKLLMIRAGPASRRQWRSCSRLSSWAFPSRVSNPDCCCCYTILLLLPRLLSFSLPSTNVGRRFVGGQTEWNAASLLLPARLRAWHCCAGVRGSPPWHMPAVATAVTPFWLARSLSPTLGLARVSRFMGDGGSWETGEMRESGWWQDERPLLFLLFVFSCIFVIIIAIIFFIIFVFVLG